MSSKKKEVSIERLLRRSTAASKIDFEELVRLHGFVKARQLIKRASLEQHAAEVQEEEAAMHTSHAPQRFRETMQASATHGGLAGAAVLDKLLATNRGVREIERRAALGDVPPDLLRLIRRNELQQTQQQQNHSQDEFLRDHRVQHALHSEDDRALLVSNADSPHLPLDCGETLLLQTAYLRRVVCTRNNITSLASPAMPQFSLSHLRYVRVLNLSLNKIRRLPDDFSALRCLEELDLSGNLVSRLPKSVFALQTTLHSLDLSANAFSALPDEFAQLHALTHLNLSQNLFDSLPHAVVRLPRLRRLRMARNALRHLAVLPPLLRKEDLFVKTHDRATGREIFVNILTRERVAHVALWRGGENVQRQRDLHVFQSGEDPQNALRYRRRRLWLSVCGVHEWEPAADPVTGQWFFKNNVSGETRWAMPAALDALGLAVQLEELDLQSNALAALPQSFCSLQRLRRVVLTKNRLMALPDEIGAMRALESLHAASNELQLLPLSLCECVALKELILDDNHLVRLPENVGLSPALQRLHVTANRLRALPFSLGVCASLQSLRAAENPLEDPPLCELDKGVPHVQWYLRNRQSIATRGAPPSMAQHSVGIAGEVTILHAELAETIAQRIEAAKKDGALTLQLLGLQELPRQVVRAAPALRRLRLDFNDAFRIDEFPIELKDLDTLSFKSCRMPSLPENVFIFKRLTTLNLEENRIEVLPHSLTELVGLTSLNLSKNRLYSLPNDLYKLRRLTQLNLEANYLEELPEDVGRMAKMRNLNVAKNRLWDVPETLCDLTGLKVLNLEKNRLRVLPPRVADMELVELRVGHNVIERLGDELFSRALGRTIECFSCVENNLLELPSSLAGVKVQCVLEADYNPLLSPPQYLLSEGFAVVQHYLQIREARRQLLYSLIADEDFDLSLSSFGPVACEVLEDGTGFLTPEDLAALDAAVNEYCNGEFFKCPATAEEIVARLAALRDERETEMYLLVVRALLTVLRRLQQSEDEELKALYQAAVFSDTRPWGKDGEACSVWVVSLSALLRDLPPNVLFPAGRVSLFSLVAREMPPIAFPFTVDLVKDSLRLYQSPYGQIADTEKTVFPTCECVDEEKNRPRRHMPCAKAAVVLVKSLYVEEEAQRREVEEDEFLERFADVEDEIRVWFATETGRRELDKEIRRRKQSLREEVSLREEMASSVALKLKKSLDALHRLEKRKALFDDGAGIEMHGFNDAETAIKLVAETRAEIETAEEKLKALAESTQRLKDELALDWKTTYSRAMEELVNKYCKIAHEKSVYAFRRHATMHGLLRHWDGEDGDAFAAWKKQNVVLDGEGEFHFANDPSAREKDAEDEEDEAEARKLKVGVLPPEFDWLGTENMKQYHLNIYNRYRSERGPVPLVK